MLLFLLTFIILVLLASFFICSIYHLTRSWIEIQPNNKRVLKGYILKYWSFFIEMQKGVEEIIYNREALENKLNDLKMMLPNIGNKFSLIVVTSTLTATGLSKEDIVKAEQAIKCRIVNPVDDYYIFYTEEPVYYLPEWIRKPLSSCPICMASPFGTIIWFSFIHLTRHPFIWSNYPHQCIFLFYIIFVVILSQLNAIVYRNTFEYVL